MKYKSEMQKIKRYSHNLRIVINVFYWTAVAAACGSIIAAVVITLISDSNFVLSEGSMGFSLDGLIRYDINEDVSQGVNMKNIYTTILIMSAVLSALLVPALKQLVLILKTVEEGNPFSAENARRISIFGVVLMLGSFIVPALEVIVANTVIAALGLQSLGTNYSVNIVLVLTGFMMFILSGIFRYGSYLQLEHDETV